MIILILPKGDQPEKFKCPVCREEYATYFEAMNCPEIHGFPKENFKNDDTVICIAGPDKGIIGVLISVSYAKPGHMSRKPHTPIYTIKIKKNKETTAESKQDDRKYTTAHENEIAIYQGT